MMTYIGVFCFFVTFFRLSLLNPNFFLAIIPGVFGFLLFLKNISESKTLKMNKKYIGLVLLIFIFFSYCIIVDLLQTQKNLNSMLSLRILSIVLLSASPAFFISKAIISNDFVKLRKILFYSILLQLCFFLITYLDQNMKSILFNIIGQGDSILLEQEFINLRGFGLSGEINFMSPSLMVIICYLFFYEKFLLKLIVIITQILNSNMVIISLFLSYLTKKVKVFYYLSMAILIFLFYIFLGNDFVHQYFPRLYHEFFLEDNSNSSFSTLLRDHIFVIRELDFFSFLFGFQENISSASNVSSINKTSDIGWVILFNYGGMCAILLLTIILYSISSLIFRRKRLVFIWFLVGMIFNSKGMIIGMNGYMFLSSLFLFTGYFNQKDIMPVRV